MSDLNILSLSRGWFPLVLGESVIFVAFWALWFIFAATILLTKRHFARAVLASAELDSRLYTRWGSPKAGRFFVRQQDFIKLMFAEYQILTTRPGKLTGSSDLAMTFLKLRSMVVAINLLGTFVVILYFLLPW